MNEVCRLCCSSEEVNNDIFSENNKLYPKMTYLPVKISKDDGLSHKLCDKCKCKVLDFHVFCLLILEAQNTLQSIMQEAVSAESQNSPEGSGPLMVIDKSEINDELETEDEPEIFLESVPQSCDLKMEYNPFDEFSPKQDNVSPSGKITEKLNSKVIQAQSKHSEVRSMTPTGPINIKKKKMNDSNTDTDDEGIHTISNDAPLLRSLLEGQQGFKPTDQPAKQKHKKLRDEPNKSNHKRKAKLQSDKTTSSQRATEEDEEMAEQEGATYECCVCLAKLDTKKDLLQHYSEHLNVSKAPAEPNVPPFPVEDPKENLAKCSRCGQVVSRRSWDMHWLEHWAADIKPRRVHCRMCKCSFTNAETILKHGLKHEDPEHSVAAVKAPKPPQVECDLCNCNFITINAFVAHRRREHVDSDASVRFGCALCPRQCSSGALLRRHLNRHRGAKQTQCPRCGKLMANPSTLKHHLRRHDGIKPYKCETCGKGFVESSRLSEHRRVHSGELPFACPVCRKGFNQRSARTIHMRIHTGERPFVCERCGRGFVARGLLTAHLKAPCARRPRH